MYRKVGKKNLLKSSDLLKVAKLTKTSSMTVKHGKVMGLRKPAALTKKHPKAKGVGLGYDKKGFFIYTHRARSKSYSEPGKIPIKDIIWVDSTG